LQTLPRPVELWVLTPEDDDLWALGY
jgi:hypothetical protein